MTRFYGTVGVAGLLLIGTVLPIAKLGAAPAVSSEVLISEIQTGSDASASQEFIELANISQKNIDISEWRVEYFSASPKNFDTPTRVMPLRGVLPAGQRYLLASSGYLVGVANDSFSAGLSAAGGHLRLIAPNIEKPTEPVINDLVGWGSAAYPLDAAAVAPKVGASLERRTLDGQLQNTQSNAADFQEATPSPQGFVAADDTEDPAPIEDLGPGITLQITELLPNPAAPQTDAADEYVELYNPNSTRVELEGYKLQTGTTYSHTYTFTTQAIGPNAYSAFYISDTGVVLANSAGKARLVNASGVIVSETADYTDAPDGQAWAWDGSSWQWTTEPSPNMVNTMVAPDKTNDATASASATSKKTATAKKSKTATSSNAKKVKAASTSADGQQKVGGSTAAEPKPATRSLILAVIGGLAVLYGAYEYRQDIKNYYHRLVRDRKISRTARAKA